MTRRFLFALVLVSFGFLLSGAGAEGSAPTSEPASSGIGHELAPAPRSAPSGARAGDATTALSVAPDTLLPVRYEPGEGKLLLEVRRLDEDLLYLNTLATGLGSTRALLDRGQVGEEAVVRFERRGPRVLLVRRNTDHRAPPRDPALVRSVEESFPRSVLASFPVVEEGPGGPVVDATDFFLSDVFDVVRRLEAAELGKAEVDGDRSHVVPEFTKAFPENTEVRASLTYAVEDPDRELERLAPDGRWITLQQHHSFVQLPDDGFRPRPFHPRAGIFPIPFFDFSEGFDEDYVRRHAMRWRLEPSDPEAYLRGELVEPEEPIVYYMDPAIPEPYRSAFREGAMWWNEILEAAGFRDAFRVEELPPDVDPLDARYNVIHWVHREERGPSVGPSYHDPRTGEILKTVVRMDSYRSLVDHDIYMGLVPAAGEEGLSLDAEEFAMARRRQHAAHEVGHTLGLAHNFIAAAQGRASVMDYPYALVRPDGEGGIDVSQAYRPSGGAHDSLAVRYAYTWYPDAEAEEEGLAGIVRDATERGMRFVTGGHASPDGAYPEATRWVEGGDMLEALERTLAVRRILLESFDERAVRPGDPLSELNRRFAHVYLHHRYALQGATKYVGGMEFTYSLRGDGTVPTRIVLAEEQRRALETVLSTLSPEELRVPERVAELIPPTPFGWDERSRLVDSPAGPAFDPVATAHSLAQEVVDRLLHPERAARLVSFHARDADNPSLDEVVGALLEATWGPGGAGSVDEGAARSTGGVASAGGAVAAGDAHDAALSRVARRAALDGLLDLAGSPDATAEVRAVAELHLRRLADRLEEGLGARAGGPDGGGLAAEERALRETALRDVRRYFRGEDDPSLRPRPAPIPLPWP